MKTMIFDTETTDLMQNIGMPIDRQPDCIEFFGLELIEGPEGELTEGRTLGQLIKPRKPVTDFTKNLTGISNEMLADKYSFKFYAPMIKDYIESFDLVVAHNCAFDKDIINTEMQRCNLEVNWPDCICTVEMTLWIKGFRMKLGGLHIELFGEDFADKHRAEPDVRALARCYIELRKRDWI